ncbi:type II secretion system F family protein [Salsuginibacillus kocurii]|uniref:type II secretion system F family protein n=1 Tax=Salsuginibacillus kocurii TaxID=427078 RepID=UPI00037EE520|nr:type II secretion system F family protein [Salsuginibacillus kocurii]
MVVLSVSFFIFMTLLFYALFVYRFERSYIIQRRLKTYFLQPSPVTEELPEENVPFFQRVILPYWTNLKRKYQRQLNRGRTSELEMKLLQAGQPFGWGPVEFRIFQSVLLVTLPVGTAGFLLLLGVAVTQVVFFTLGAVVAAVFFPRYYLKMKSKKRNEQALKELPDTLDLLTISLEAGLGFDAALNKVVSSKQGVLSDEFRLCLEELRLGRTRKEALNGLKERLTFNELHAFVYNVIQAEKLGIGMVSVLKIQSEDVRENRRQRAEEAAMKAPIKMLFPLILFIFPTLFIIVLGPALLQFMEAF